MRGGPPPDPCAALAKFLSTNATFTASAKVVRQGKKPRETQTMVMAFAASGGKMRNGCDLCLCVPSRVTARIQEMHITIGHAICELLEDNLAEK